MSSNADTEASHDWQVPAMPALLLTSARASGAADDQVSEK
jgi:hypothetical protein